MPKGCLDPYCWFTVVVFFKPNWVKITSYVDVSHKKLKFYLESDRNVSLAVQNNGNVTFQAAKGANIMNKNSDM